MQNLTKSLKNKTIFYVAPDPLWATGLEGVLPDYKVICVDDSDVVPYLQEKGVSVFCLERELGKQNIVFRNSAKILSEEKVTHFIKNNSSSTPNIIVFKPSPSLERIAQEQDFNLIAVSSNLNRTFEDKILFSEILEKLRIRLPSWEEVIISLDIFKELELKFDLPFVIQLGRGFAGSSTYFVNSEKNFQDLCQAEQGKTAKVSQFIKGTPYTLNACVTKKGVLISRPFYQITGRLKFTRSVGGTCGNDFSREDLGNNTLSQIYSSTQKIGEYMGEKGFKGIFGLDFIVDNNQIYFIENNARLVASIPLFTRMQLEKNEAPLLLSHILELLDINYHFDFNEEQKKLEEKKYGAQLILRNIFPYPVILNNEFKSGIYKLEQDKLVLQRNTVDFMELGKKTEIQLIESKPDEFLIISAAQGRKVNPGIEFARVQTRSQIVSKDENLSEEVEKVADIVKRKVGIEKA